MTKRSVPLDESVAAQVDGAAREDGSSFSAWLSDAAEHRLLYVTASGVSPNGRPNRENRPRRSAPRVRICSTGSSQHRRRTRLELSGNELTYVTGALISAERDDPVLWALHRAALERGTVPTVPAGVLAEAWRGGPQQHLSRLLKGCRIEALTEDQARAIGVLIPTSGVHNTGPPTAGPHWSALRYAPVVQPVPARSSGVLASQMGDRAIAYDLVTETAHRLNGIAGDLLSECTGHGDLVQLIDRWAELTGAPRQVVAADVDAALR